MPVQVKIENAYATLTFNSYGKVRKETMGGESFTVVPVVLITTGSFRGNHGELHYTANHLKRFPEGWNNKPVLLGHPNSPKGAGSSSVLEEQGIGILLNAKFAGGKLKAEAWLRDNRLSLDSRLAPAISSGLPIPVSTGLFHDVEVTNNAEGETRSVCNIVPDHLAILLDEAPACSITEGAGLLMNAKGKTTTNALVSGDLREQLQALLKNRFGGGIGSPSMNPYIDDMFFDPAIVIFYMNDDLFKLAYTVEDDVVSLADEVPDRVVRQRQYRLETGALITNNSEGKQDMTKATLIAGILASGVNRLTAEQLEGMDEAVLSALAPIEAPAPAPAATTNSAPQLAPAQSFAQLLAAAPANVREAIEDGITTNQAARVQMVTELTANAACAFSSQELDAMPITALRKMHATVTGSIAAATPPAPTTNSMFPVLRNFGPTATPAPVTRPAETESTNNAAGPARLLAPAWNAK